RGFPRAGPQYGTERDRRPGGRDHGGGTPGPPQPGAPAARRAHRGRRRLLLRQLPERVRPRAAARGRWPPRGRNGHRGPGRRGRWQTMTLLKIANGTVYDPANGIDGEVRDLWIRDGKVVGPPASPDERPDRVLDAAGLVVMPGGVDMHAHIAGPKVNVARKMR